MLHESDFDADPLTHDVVNVSRTASGEQVSENFKRPFAKMQAYRRAKEVADKRREKYFLTEQQAEHEQKTRNEFLDIFRNPHQRGLTVQ